MVGRVKYEENPTSGIGDTAKTYFVLQVKCPELLTDRNQT